MDKQTRILTGLSVLLLTVSLSAVSFLVFVEHEVATLRATVTSIQRDMLANPTAIAAPGLPSRDAVMRPSDEATRRFAKLESRLAEEKADRKWESWVRNTARDSLERKAPTATLVNAKCGITICALTIRQQSREQRAQLAFQIGREAPFDSGAIYQNEEGNFRTRVIVARKGQDLRTLSEE